MGEVGRPLVAGDDSGILPHEQDGDGLSDVVAGSDHDREFAAEGNAGVLDHPDHGEGRAGGQGRSPVDDVADVRGIDAFDVLVGVDEPLDGVRLDADWQGHVNHDCRHIVLGVQQQDAPGDVVLGGGGGQFVQDVVDAELGACAGLALGVLTGGVVGGATEQRVEADGPAGLTQGAGAGGDLFAFALRQGFAVDDPCGHGHDDTGTISR